MLHARVIRQEPRILRAVRHLLADERSRPAHALAELRNPRLESALARSSRAASDIALAGKLAQLRLVGHTLRLTSAALNHNETVHARVVLGQAAESLEALCIKRRCVAQDVPLCIKRRCKLRVLRA